jgi:5-methylcytosine-specific restriction endonuclease McrA
MFQDRFYWEEEGYSAEEVKALVLAADLRRERRLEQAIALTAQAGANASPARPPIPEEVRIAVWRRDRGRCVRCSSQRNLEFDHIIPIALGGSNTARNLQLLCEACNREKGASLG